MRRRAQPVDQNGSSRRFGRMDVAVKNARNRKHPGPVTERMPETDAADPATYKRPGLRAAQMSMN